MDEHVTRSATQLASPFPVVRSKSRQPVQRPGIVERTRLLERVGNAQPWSVMAVVAAAGYGKTTVLQQWARRQDVATAWVTLGPEDNDLAMLLASLATALDEAIDVDPEILHRLDNEFPAVGPVSRAIVNTLADTPEPVLVVVDDLHVLANPACLDVVDMLAREATPTARVALGSRHEIGGSLPRLRAEGLLVEVGPEDLAMDPAETATLATGAGVALSHDDATQLVATTEGWPAALYLWVRATAHRPHEDRDLVAPGRHRSVDEYIRAELLASLDADTVQFMTRASVLERMSGPSCDAVLRTFGSGERLRALAESNLLVVPEDEERTWFRYHQLMHDALRTQLHHHEPELATELTRRASVWHEANGMLDDAVEYSMAAGDGDRVAEFVGNLAPGLYQAGRILTLQRWFDWFEQHDLMDRHPGVAVAGAWTAALLGQAAVATRRSAAATRARPRERLVDAGADAVDGLVALVRATLFEGPLDQVLEDAEHAARLVGPRHPWRPSTLIVLGLARMVAGDDAGADLAFVEVAEVTTDLGAWPGLSVALAERALLALGRDEGRRARELAGQALDVVDRHGLGEHMTSGIVFAAAARMASRTGDAERARGLWTRTQRLRPHLTHAVPHFSVQTRLELARTALTLADVGGARTLLREVDEIVRLRPGLGRFEEDFHRMRVQLERMPAGLAGPTSLTPAELRLLPLLRTHLSFREIGERLFVSPNTVKTQAISVYRKLGVSSRSDAITRAAEIGLLEDWAERRS